MKIKVAVLIMLVLLTAFVAGCFSRSFGKTTGVKYILSKGSLKEFPENNQVKQELPGVSNQHQTKAPGVSNQQQIKASEVPNQQQIKAHGMPDKQQAKSPSGIKTVYLTFDDGPNNTETPMILDILDSYGVKGTFFVIGTNIEQYPKVLKDEVRRGHAIGNHTYDHKYSEVYASNAAFLGSIKQNEQLIFKVVGKRPKIVRDPGGEVRNNKVLKGLLAQNGYSLVDWNLDSYDSRKPGLDGAQIVESVRRQTAKPYIRSHMIILMHDGKGHMNTVRALPTIIEMLKNQGFKFATLE